MELTPLSQELTARLLAAEYHRLKSERRVLCDESCILHNLRSAEARLHDARPSRGLYCFTARYRELVDDIRLCHETWKKRQAIYQRLRETTAE